VLTDRYGSLGVNRRSRAMGPGGPRADLRIRPQVLTRERERVQALLRFKVHTTRSTVRSLLLSERRLVLFTEWVAQKLSSPT
jgi:hypothetical protein